MAEKLMRARVGRALGKSIRCRIRR